MLLNNDKSKNSWLGAHKTKHCLMTCLQQALGPLESLAACMEDIRMLHDACKLPYLRY